MSAIQITQQNFESEVLKSEVPVLLDFWAPWCGPCRMVGPIVDELATELQGKAKIGKINVDEQSELASQFRVSSIPTLAVVSGGKVLQTTVGAVPKVQLIKMLGL
ncbi:MAG: thioredoxin [Hyphomonadaceae bacterium]|nr:thioredoxin [Clostridia bacterium]